MVPDDQISRPLGTAWPTTLTVDGQTFTREDTVFSSESPTTQYGTQTINYYRLKSTQPTPTPTNPTIPSEPDQQNLGSGGGSDEEFLEDGNTFSQE